MDNWIRVPKGLSKEEEDRWYRTVRRRCLHYGVVCAFLVAMLAISVVAGSKDASAGGLFEENPAEVTIFRGNGVSVLDTESGEVTVKKEPTKTKKVSRKQPRRTGARIVGGGDDTLWYVDSRGKLRACTTVGNGYTGGGMNIRCTR